MTGPERKAAQTSPGLDAEREAQPNAPISGPTAPATQGLGTGSPSNTPQPSPRLSMPWEAKVSNAIDTALRAMREATRARDDAALIASAETLIRAVGDLRQ